MKFCEFLALRGINAKGIALTQYRIKKVKNFTKKQVENCLMDTLSHHTKATFNRYIGCFRLYAHYLISEGKKTPKDLEWLFKIKRIKETNTARAIFSPYELQKFLSVDDRYSMYFHLLSRTGARPMEIAKLKKIDVDFTNEIFTIRESKTGEDRVVPIPEELTQNFAEFLQKNNSPWCFPIKNFPKRHTTIESIRKAFRKRKDTLRLNPQLTPYCFRHTFITRMLGAGVPLFVVQKIVGHKRADTTQKYFHLSLEMMKEGLKKDPIVWDTLPNAQKLKDVDEYISALGLDNHKDFSYTRSNDKIILQIINN